MAKICSKHLFSRQGGLTAFELVVSLAVIAIILALAVPSLKEYSLNNRMKSAVNRFHTALTLARSEAILRNGRIVMCPTAGESHCTDQGDWHNGWSVFLDQNDDRQRQDEEPMLWSEAAFENLTIRSSRHRIRLRFFGNGTAPGSNANITFCDRRGSRAARQISLSASGRIRVKNVEDTENASCEA